MKRLIIVFLLLFVPCAALAEKMTVAFQEFPPYNYRDQSGRILGSSIEIVTQVLKRMEYEAVFKLLPWNRAYREAAKGNVPLLVTFSKSAEREKDFFFTAEIARVEVVFFKRKTDAITWNRLSDLKSYRIGYIQGYNYGRTMMGALENNVFDKPDMIPASASADYQQMMKLMKNRIDLAVCPKLQCTQIIKMKAPKLDGLDFIDKPIGPARSFFGGFSKKWPHAEALRNRFDDALEELRKEGQLERIWKKYNL